MPDRNHRRCGFVAAGNGGNGPVAGANGKFLAIRATAYQALGAYWWAAATAPLPPTKRFQGIFRLTIDAESRRGASQPRKIKLSAAADVATMGSGTV
jgi:hypothetical protein